MVPTSLDWILDYGTIWGLIGSQGARLALEVISRGLTLILKQTGCQSEGGLLTDNHSSTTYFLKRKRKKNILVELHLNNVLLCNNVSVK